MPTPSIQTLRADAQQVLNLDSISAVRSVVAATLANANAGTPLNPNLTTQQLWNEFYQIVTQPKSDIESIIANQLMKFLYAPPAPGGVGADKRVIFNDGGVLAGDPQFLWNKTTNLLTVTGATTITGDLTVDTSTLKVDSANNRVGIGTASPTEALHINRSSGAGVFIRLQDNANTNYIGTDSGNFRVINNASQDILNIQQLGVFTFGDGAGGTRMTLNSTGLGVGVSPATKFHVKGGLPVFRLDNSSTGLNQFDTGVDSLGAYFRTYVVDGIRWYNAAGGIPMTLDASGNLLVGDTVVYANERIRSKTTTTNYWSINMESVNRGWLNRQSDSNGGIAAYFEVGGGTNVGSITTTSSGTSFVTTSDYRLKESVQPLVGGIARVSALKPSIYKWKIDGSNGEGFLAHELAEVVPFAVTGEKDAVNEDGSIKPQGVDLSKIVPVLVAAIQELTARVQTLETR